MDLITFSLLLSGEVRVNLVFDGWRLLKKTFSRANGWFGLV